MTAVDSNVPLRHLTRDDEAQAEKARQVFTNNDERVLITDVVLAETTWTLAGRR